MSTFNPWKKIALLAIYTACRVKRKSDVGLLVITYHRICEIPCLSDPLIVSAETFENQIAILQSHYRILSGPELASCLKSGEGIPPKSCLITFDDGWRDNYIHAYPLLKRHKVPALVFLTTDFIGTNHIFWYVRLRNAIENISKNMDRKEMDRFLRKVPQDLSKILHKIFTSTSPKRMYLIQDLIVHLKCYHRDQINALVDTLEENNFIRIPNDRRVMLSWQEVKEMAEGNIMFGSHTKTHALLSTIPTEDVIAELSESKKVIEEKLGEPVYFLSYPNGFYNTQTVSIAKEVGYLGAFTCESGINDTGINPFELRRKHLREQYSIGFDGKISELFFKVDLSDIRNRIRPWRKNEAY